MDTVQLFFLESTRKDLEALLKTLTPWGLYSETRIHGPVPEKIYTAEIDAGELTKIKKYGPKKRKEYVKAERFALGRIGTYSKDLQIEDFPFVHIDNHPSFPEGIRFTYYKKADVKERGGKTSDEAHGYARYEFETRGDKIFAPAVHAFLTYADGPAMISNLGTYKEIPLVLYLTEKGDSKHSSNRDKEALGLKLDNAIRTLIELGTDGSFINLHTGTADLSPLHNAMKLADTMLKMASGENRRLDILLKRRALVNQGRCYEALKMHDDAINAYNASLGLTPVKRLSPVEQEDVDSATSAIERLNKR